ncbi:MAG: hypothetical protein SO049_05560 [Prevotella sp.]|nr:hypothetical protein [Prevotella sp.]MDY4967325.1 hypothetical protein [Prevotella sp.]
MNGHVRYTYNADTTAILFVVPIVRVRSQKTYSVNHQHISLIGNLFAFRSENIFIEVE